MKTIVLVSCFILCLIPTVALGDGAVKLHFHDKTTMCGEYTLKGDKYCKSIGGGDVCWDKADIASVEKTDECEEGGGYATGGTSASVDRGKDTTNASARQNEATRSERFPPVVHTKRKLAN